MSTLPLVPFLTFEQTRVRLGYKTRKSVSDLVASGKLTPVRPPVLRGKHAPLVYFDEAQVDALAPNPTRLSRLEVAERLGIHPRTVDRMVERGQLAALPAPRGSRRKIEFEAAEIERVKALAASILE